MNVDLYKKLACLIEKHTGIIYKEADFYRLTSRMNQMKDNFALNNEEELVEFLETSTDRSIIDYLCDVATNNETSFFRDKKPFDAIGKHVLSYFKQDLAINSVNALSLACSTGQEPVSLLITLLETDFFSNSFHIDATDISKNALDKAISGKYSQLEVQRGLPIKLLIKYFNKQDNDWVLKDEFKNKINYFKSNLLESTYQKDYYHIVFCRNVLIYHEIENRNKILQKAYDSLRPGGLLVLGSGESLINSKTKFSMRRVGETIMYLKDEEKKFDNFLISA